MRSCIDSFHYMPVLGDHAEIVRGNLLHAPLGRAKKYVVVGLNIPDDIVHIPCHIQVLDDIDAM